MTRIAVYLRTTSTAETKAVFEDVLGLRVDYDEGERCVVLADDRDGQLIALTREIAPDAPVPDLLIEVDDVDAIHDRVQRAGLKVVYPLTDEPWGARRFFVSDHDGNIINVLQRRLPAEGH